MIRFPLMSFFAPDRNRPARIASATRAISPESARSRQRRRDFAHSSEGALHAAPAFSGRRNSRPSAAASNSIASRFSARSTIDRSFSAPVIPMEHDLLFRRKSSIIDARRMREHPRFVHQRRSRDMRNHETGLHSGMLRKKRGKPSLKSGLTSRSIRRSLMLIRSVIAIAA